MWGVYIVSNLEKTDWFQWWSTILFIFSPSSPLVMVCGSALVNQSAHFLQAWVDRRHWCHYIMPWNIEKYCEKYCDISLAIFNYIIRHTKVTENHWAWWRHQMQTFSALLAICVGNSPVMVNSPHKGQWRGALMFSLVCTWIHGWVNNREAGDLRCHHTHYDIIVMESGKHGRKPVYLFSQHYTCWCSSTTGYQDICMQSDD